MMSYRNRNLFTMVAIVAGMMVIEGHPAAYASPLGLTRSAAFGMPALDGSSRASLC
jgi:hypothetical protein